jgi:hypothetical protein
MFSSTTRGRNLVIDSLYGLVTGLVMFEKIAVAGNESTPMGVKIKVVSL